jgi:hypothetical protein
LGSPILFLRSFCPPSYPNPSAGEFAVDAFEGRETATEKLETYVTSVFDWAKKHSKDARVWLLFFYYCSFLPGYKKLNTELAQQGHQRIGALLNLGIQTGEFKVKDVPYTAKLIQGVINGGFVEVLSERTPAMGFDFHEATLALCLAIAQGSRVR